MKPHKISTQSDNQHKNKDNNLQKQKSFILKKNQAVVSKYAKIGPKDGTCCPNFQ